MLSLLSSFSRPGPTLAGELCELCQSSPLASSEMELRCGRKAAVDSATAHCESPRCASENLNLCRNPKKSLEEHS